jgi:hypothetical protein
VIARPPRQSDADEMLDYLDELHRYLGQAFIVVEPSRTDNAAAIQAASDEAGDTNGTVVFLNQRYTVDSAITITDTVRWMGLGPASEIYTTAAIDTITINPTVSEKTIQIWSLKLTGGTNPLHVAGPSGGYISRFSSFRDLDITGFTGKGIFIEAGMIGTQHDRLNIEAAATYGLYSAGDDFPM